MHIPPWQERKRSIACMCPRPLLFFVCLMLTWNQDLIATWMDQKNIQFIKWNLQKQERSKTTINIIKMLQRIKEMVQWLRALALKAVRSEFTSVIPLWKAGMTTHVREPNMEGWIQEDLWAFCLNTVKQTAMEEHTNVLLWLSHVHIRKHRAHVHLY